MENTLALDRQVELRSACGGSVRVIGTSHLSSTSAATVLSVVSSLKPESVACELDVHRAVMTGLLSSVEEADGRNPRILAPYFDAKHTWPGTMALLFALMMSGPTAMLTPLVDEFPYGADQAAAVRSAADCGASVAFVDRNQSVTLARVAAKLTLLDVLNAMPAFIGGISSPPNVKTPTPLLCKLMWQCMWRNFVGIADTLDEVVADNAAKDVIFSASSAGRTFHDFNSAVINVIRHGRATAEAQAELGRAFHSALAIADRVMTDEVDPAMVPLRHERDLLLARAIKQLPGKHVVAVVGAAHVDGIVKNWDTCTDADVAPLLQAPPMHTLRTITLPLAAVVGGAYAGWRLRTRAPRLVAGAAAGVLTLVACTTALLSGANAVHTRVHTALSVPSKA